MVDLPTDYMLSSRNWLKPPAPSGLMRSMRSPPPAAPIGGCAGPSIMASSKEG